MIIIIIIIINRCVVTCFVNSRWPITKPAQYTGKNNEAQETGHTQNCNNQAIYKLNFSRRLNSAEVSMEQLEKFSLNQWLFISVLAR